MKYLYSRQFITTNSHSSVITIAGRLEIEIIATNIDTLWEDFYWQSWKDEKIRSEWKLSSRDLWITDWRWKQAYLEVKSIPRKDASCVPLTQLSTKLYWNCIILLRFSCPVRKLSNQRFTANHANPITGLLVSCIVSYAVKFNTPKSIGLKPQYHIFRICQIEHV